MQVDHQCRWVRHRLPLLAGGELAVDERRRVERHLIGCEGCRGRRDASAGALDALRALAQEPPAGVAAPSLWPALSTQIRQSRHAAPRLPWWEAPLSRPWGPFALAMGLGAVVVVGLVQPPPAPEKPDAPPSIVASPAPEAAKPPVLASAPRSALPAPARAGALPQGNPAAVDHPSTSLQFNYDLDYMTPMTHGSRDPQNSY